MIRKLLSSLIIAASLAGCAADVGPAPKADFDVAADDAVIFASEGLADSATRPTVVSELESGDVGVGRFTRSKKYLAFFFDAVEGDEITLRTTSPDPEDLDTVLILYKATSSGRPSGASIAVNDDISDNNYMSELEYTAEESRRYVAVIRRYDRGSSGSFNLLLDITSHAAPVACGGRRPNPCGTDEFCNFAEGANCGRADGGGTCEEIPDVCPRNIRMVCGCNGETYTNACQAHAAGVSVDHDGSCESHCPATGVSCTPECPGSGRLNGRPCHRGNFNSETCTCDPIADCRTLGCDEGRTCKPCWAAHACIPDGAVC